jgi:hypothetical protein
MSVHRNTGLIHVFIYMSVHFGAKAWQKTLAREKILGINDRLPYGYYRAAEDGCLIVYSEDKIEPCRAIIPALGKSDHRRRYRPCLAQ